MRFAPPLVADVVPEVAAGVNRLVGVIMSPQYSPIIMSGYVRTLQDAAADLEPPGSRPKIAEDWHMQPVFLAGRGRTRGQALEQSRRGPRACSRCCSARTVCPNAWWNVSRTISSTQRDGGRNCPTGGLARRALDVLLPERRPHARRMAQARLRRRDARTESAGHTHVLIAACAIPRRPPGDSLRHRNRRARTGRRDGIVFARTDR